MIRISFSEYVAQDLQEIYEYIAKDNILAADQHQQRLMRRWQQLADQPRLGRKRDDVRTGYRSISEGDYVILYRIVSTEELMVMRVVHGKRDLGKLELSSTPGEPG